MPRIQQDISVDTQSTVENEGVLALAAGEESEVESSESEGYIEAQADEEEAAPESPYTDDFVRVYLREMGAVSLLTRQGEINLARGMDLGRVRVRKALSRSVLIQKMAMDLHEEVRRGELKLEHILEG